MKQSNQFLNDMLDMDHPQAVNDIIHVAGGPTEVHARNGQIEIQIPFHALQKGCKVQFDNAVQPQVATLIARAYGDSVIRLTLRAGAMITGDDSPMLAFHRTLKPASLAVIETATGWKVVDGRRKTRLLIARSTSQLQPAAPLAPPPACDITVLPDGRTAVPFNTTDRFFPMCVESFSMAYVTRDGRPDRCAFSLTAAPGEHFCGTGERFAQMDLAGRTLTLENSDGLGVNNRRCYKNIPFYLSSRPYGLFLHTHVHTRLSLADISTRAAQAVVEDQGLDLFFIGGGSPERILFNYRRITGFPPELPAWSYGVWMSRMSYSSADEVREVARKMREQRFPLDVLHLDVGWFEKEWECDWEFSRSKFPDPAGLMRDLRKQGIRISLWQLPHVGKTTKLYCDAVARKFALQSELGGRISDSIFSGLEYVATIDFTNPDAVIWYKALLARLLRLGAAAIKCDFGEHIHMDLNYHSMAAKHLHNLFPLLYQQAAFDTVREITGDGIIWARSGWAGAQRYPLHWGGDSAGSWDGMAGTLRGGLHLGLSGFAFWSHDIPGFHGVPDFMQTKPGGALYLRWTQFGVLSSHMRYHGAQAREPYAYPEVADAVRHWWNLRYALIPYLLEESRKSVRGGMPLLRSMMLHYPDDPNCWRIDDQFLCGSALLAAPVMNDAGIRDVYLPDGEWVDFWTGKTIKGPVWLKNLHTPLSRMPIYAVKGAKIKVYPEPVNCTDEMNLKRCATIHFDKRYRGLSRSILGEFIRL
ncbi:MAG: TIM-barrel domain-containing protein [bacterium]